MSFPALSPATPIGTARRAAGGHPTRAALPVAILGGGITGLSAAWALRQHGVAVRVFEGRATAGGVMDSIREGEWLREDSPAIAALCDSLGLQDRRLEAAKLAGKRFVVRHGKMVALPASPLEFVFTPLLSWRAKLGVLAEPFRARGSPAREETVAQFVKRRLGGEFLDAIVNPFVAGIYAGDPTRLSVKHAFPKLHALERDHGSLLRGAFKLRNARGAPRGRMISFRDGLAEIPRAIAGRLGGDLLLRHAVLRVQRTGS